MMQKAIFQVHMLFLVLSTSAFYSCGVIRSMTMLAPNSDDYRHDPQVIIEASEHPYNFHTTSPMSKLGNQIMVQGESEVKFTLDEFSHNYSTEALLIIRNDSIIYESYPEQEGAIKPVSSFSISKAIMTTLTGIAIKEGLIESLDQYVWEFLPDWKEKGFNQLRIKDLMQHTSGMKFNKSIYNPMSDQVQFYYGRNLQRRMRRRKPEIVPGEQFDYQSANTILLTMVLEKATGVSIADYLERSIWTPLGMEDGASWSLDRRGPKGIVRTFCCLQAMARDFAKLGKLWINDGNWNGKQILPPGYMKSIIKGDRDTGRYRSGFRIINNQPVFYTSGLLGQYIYMFPEKNLIILRFGEYRERYSGRMWWRIFREIADQL